MPYIIDPEFCTDNPVFIFDRDNGDMFLEEFHKPEAAYDYALKFKRCVHDFGMECVYCFREDH